VLVEDGLVKERSTGTSSIALLVGLVGKVQIMYATSTLMLGERPYLLWCKRPQRQTVLEVCG
jgi:hypothetical protein